MTARESATSRRRSVVATVASEELAPLDLQELRAHRRLMGAEDDRVSYWSSLTLARIDGLETKRSETALTRSQLVRALGDTGSGLRRRTISRQSGGDLLPVLPSVSHMWARDVDPSDGFEVGAALEGLWPAERQLTAYSAALQVLMDHSTRELILRYRDDPRAALEALPRA